MPASMMIAVVAGRPKVMGSSSEIVATGPMPGSTPMAVPISAPSSAKSRFWMLSATPKPCMRLVMRSSMVAFPIPLSSLRPQIHADIELVDEHPPAHDQQEHEQARDALLGVRVLGDAADED